MLKILGRGGTPVPHVPTPLTWNLILQQSLKDFLPFFSQGRFSGLKSSLVLFKDWRRNIKMCLKVTLITTLLSFFNEHSKLVDGSNNFSYIFSFLLHSQQTALLKSTLLQEARAFALLALKNQLQLMNKIFT